MKYTNPLRYPGGKYRLTSYIEQLILSEGLQGSVLVEPFAGSSAVALYMLKKELCDRIVINDSDILISSFWRCVFSHSDALIKKIENTPISVETWQSLEPLRQYANLDQAEDLLELGFAGLFFNRTNFSGILSANPIGGLGQKSQYKIDCRFNKQQIVRSIQDLSTLRERVTVLGFDALDCIDLYSRQRDTFFYIDPPYYEKGKMLYRQYYTDADHTALAERLHQMRSPWLVSYDDCDFIRGLYQNPLVTAQGVYLDYFVRTKQQVKELLLSNLRIPPLSAFCSPQVQARG